MSIFSFSNLALRVILNPEVFSGSSAHHHHSTSTHTVQSTVIKLGTASSRRSDGGTSVEPSASCGTHDSPSGASQGMQGLFFFLYLNLTLDPLALLSVPYPSVIVFIVFAVVITVIINVIIMIIIIITINTCYHYYYNYYCCYCCCCFHCCRCHLNRCEGHHCYKLLFSGIYVTNLSSSRSESSLKDFLTSLFKKFGKVIHIVFEMESGPNFVEQRRALVIFQRWSFCLILPGGDFCSHSF